MSTPEDQPITAWLQLVQQEGDKAAQAGLWNAYFERLITLARARLHPTERRVRDEEDVVLSVMDSFFSGVRNARFPDLRDRDNLWPLLVTITARKVANLVRDEKAKKRGGGAVRGDSIFMAGTDGGNGTGFDGLPSREPTPEFAMSVAESCRSLLDSLNDESLAKVAQLKLEAYTNNEIAEMMNCSPRTVERRLEAIRRCWSNQ